MKRNRQLDKEWVDLIAAAQIAGISPAEVRAFLKNPDMYFLQMELEKSFEKKPASVLFTEHSSN